MPPSKKTRSVLYPSSMIEKAKANAAAYTWAAEMRERIVAGAEPWLKMSDDELWGLMFGPHITRSWMVWSDGFCPNCKNDVRMYNWKMDPRKFPWKVQCPHCAMLFPTNDFEAYHKSGYDEHGIFIPDRADRSLLFNTQHPDPEHPLHTFGVDDGEGYLDQEGHRWRFIGAYLIYGQWKRWVLAAINSLSNAYLVTGDTQYAYKAAILLDRIADVFPQFVFEEQGLVYEYGPHRGQVSTWHDACGEMSLMIKAYDRIFEGARSREKDLVAFLSPKATEYGIKNSKGSWADIQRNIETNIFQETLNHRERIESNYPTTDQTILFINVALEWPANRDQALSHLDEIVEKSTGVDGLSGEKGVAGYATIAPRSLAFILASLSRIEPGFLQAVYERHPVLHQTYRFHIDTWCLDGQYYPQVGDTGQFAARVADYKGITLSKTAGIEPSMFQFLWDLYELTDDPAFVQVLYRENGNTVEGLPHDLFADDPSDFQARVKQIIDRRGTTIPLSSVNKQEWRLAILRSGEGEHRRALWIDYDAGERHSHTDGMNIGLFARGLDLIPEFGYPAVGYGGWRSAIGRWYTKTAAHVTVAVDGKDHNRVNNGVSELWADGERFRAIRVSDPTMIDGKRFERTVAMIDVDNQDFYVVDYFLVDGGKDHAKFFHSSFGAFGTHGVSLTPTEDYGHSTQMRNFRVDENPERGWSADWTIDDRYGYLPEGETIHLRHTDLTREAAAYLAESWIDPALFGGTDPEYLPTIMTRRTSDEAPLLSAFAAVIEPYEEEPVLTRIERLPLEGSGGSPLPDEFVGIRLTRNDGRTDLIIFSPNADSEIVEPKSKTRLKGRLGYVSIGPAGVDRIVLCQGDRLEGDFVGLVMKEPVEFIELRFEADRAVVAAGDPAHVETVIRNGEEMKVFPDPHR